MPRFNCLCVVRDNVASEHRRGCVEKCRERTDDCGGRLEKQKSVFHSATIHRAQNCERGKSSAHRNSSEQKRKCKSRYRNVKQRRKFDVQIRIRMQNHHEADYYNKRTSAACENRKERKRKSARALFNSQIFISHSNLR